MRKMRRCGGNGVSCQACSRNDSLAVNLKVKMPVRESSSIFNRIVHTNSLVLYALFSSSSRPKLVYIHVSLLF